VNIMVGPSAQGTAAGYSGLINPAPATSHQVGYSDIYTPIVQLLNASNTVIDQTSIGLADIESVQVLATIPPQIVFRIIGHAPGDGTYCNNTATVTTTPTQVPFGSVPLNTFVYGTQEINVSTNALNGYAVTLLADKQLHQSGVSCTAHGTTTGCIPDSQGDTGAMSFNTKAVWTSTTASTAKGFGYSLQNGTGGTIAFTHADSGGTCTGAAGNCWKAFPDATFPDLAQNILTSTGPANQHNAFVCYKLQVGSSQAAGEYTTGVMYRATSTF
jgi:hypothetical protein